MDLSYIDVVRDAGDLICFARNLDGELETFVEPLEDYCYCFIPNNTGEKTEYKNMFGNPMKRLDFETPFELNKFAKTAKDVHESDVQPIYKFLIDNFTDAPHDAPFNVGYYDIEVDFDLDDGRGYPSVQDPFGEVNGVSLFDKKNDCYVMFMLYDNLNSKLRIKIDDENYDQKPVDERYHVSERELLLDFCDYINHIDIITGWNSMSFDVPYIMERLIKLLGEKKAKKMLCRGGLSARKVEYTNDFGEETWKWILYGRHHLDMMELFIKFIPKKLESNSLENVCQTVLGQGKLPYAGDLGKLYREDPQTFFDYSIHDSRLLLWLDQKLDLIRTAMTVARFNCVLPTDVNGSVKPIETSFMKFCRKKDNIVLPDKEHHDKEDFKGAVVYDTLNGLHDWTFSIDLTALYPSVMMMLGSSKETLFAQCVNEDNDFCKIVTDSDEDVTIILEDDHSEIVGSGAEIHDYIKENGMTISASGTIFTGELGILAEFVKEGFERRNAYKKKMFEASERGDESERVKYNLLQSVQKISNNSIYGCVSNSFFRLFDIRLARSITYTGAIISKKQAHSINTLLNEKKMESSDV